MSLTDRQIEIRKSGLTATDLVVLCGADKRRTAHDVYLDKMGLAEPFEETEAMSLGTELEPIIIRRLVERRNLKWISRSPGDMTMIHPDVRHHIATPDAFFSYGGQRCDAIGQVKATGFWPGKEWGGDDDLETLPERVLIQCAWEIWVTGMPVEYIGALNGVTQLRTYMLPREHVAELIEAEREIADRFWTDHVLPKKPPPIDGSEGAARMLAAVYPKNNGAMLAADQKVEALAARYFSVKYERDAAEARRKTVQQSLIEQVGHADGIKGDGWRLLLKERAATTYTVTREAYRHFDMRETKR